MPRRNRSPRPATKPPTPPDLVLGPELAVLSVLAYVLDIAIAALLAEHPTLIDDFRRPRDDGPVLTLANTICQRAAHLAHILAAYDRAVREAAGALDHDKPDADLPF
jgi:hypothetical protein